MTAYLPVYIHSSKMTALIVGGGDIAFRKLRNLVDAKMTVEILTKEMSDELRAYCYQHQINLINKSYETGDANGYELVIAATNNTNINELIQRDAKKLICRVDDAKRGNIILPATIRRNELVIAVSTGGASPGLAKKIKKDLSAIFDERYDSYVEFLAEVRRNHSGNRKLLHAIVDERFINMTKLQRNKELEALIRLYC